MNDRQPSIRCCGFGYMVDGVPLPSVTEIVQSVLRAIELEEWFKRKGMLADTIRDEAAEFGKSIHAGLAAYVSGRKLVPLDMPEEWGLIIEAGCRWIDDNIEEVYAVEEPVASRKYGYAGRPDLYARRVGKKIPCLVDWKTSGSVYWSHAAQLAAYRTAAVETYGGPPAERIVVRLDKTEPGRVIPVPLTKHTRDFSLFTYCLGAYNIMKGEL